MCGFQYGYVIDFVGCVFQQQLCCVDGCVVVVVGDQVDCFVVVFVLFFGFWDVLFDYEDFVVDGVVGGDVVGFFDYVK